MVATNRKLPYHQLGLLHDLFIIKLNSSPAHTLDPFHPSIYFNSPQFTYLRMECCRKYSGVAKPKIPKHRFSIPENAMDILEHGRLQVNTFVNMRSVSI